MNTQTLKAKLIWQCRRGMLELDLILNQFVTHHLSNLSAQQLQAFEQLLTYPDPDLYHWLMESGQPEAQELVEIVTLIRRHHHT